MHEMGSQKILLVEDNEVNAKLIKDFLKFRGFNVSVVSNGLDVMPTALEFKPNLVLMDIQLFGISGAEATKQLRHNDETKDIPIFIISAFSRSKIIDELPEKYFNEYIEKPIVFQEFMDLVHSYIGFAEKEDKE